MWDTRSAWLKPWRRRYAPSVILDSSIGSHLCCSSPCLLLLRLLSLQGLVSSALNHALSSWAIQWLGPATLALYTPLQPLSSSLLAYFFLGSPLLLGRLGLWPLLKGDQWKCHSLPRAPHCLCTVYKDAT